MSNSAPKIPWETACRAFPWLPQTRNEIATYVEDRRSTRDTEFLSRRGVSVIHLCVEIEQDLKNAKIADVFPLIPQTWYLSHGRWNQLDRFHSSGLNYFQDVAERSLKPLQSLRGIGQVSVSDLVAALVDESVRLAEEGFSVENPATQDHFPGPRLAQVSTPPESGIETSSDAELVGLIKSYIALGKGDARPFRIGSQTTSDLPEELLLLTKKISERSAFEWLVRLQNL